MDSNPYRPSESTLSTAAAPLEAGPSDAARQPPHAPPRWFARTLAALGVGGGVLGLAIIVWVAANTPLGIAHVMFLPTTAAYAFGIYCGVAALRRSPKPPADKGDAE